MQPWLIRKLGAGLLTPLFKNETGSDARPTKAEDTDTALWSKAVQLHSVEPLCEHLKPQQMGVGVKGGVETLVLGLAISREVACNNGEDHIIMALDLKNAHNEYDRVEAQAEIEKAADECPHLSSLPAAHAAINGVHTDIFAREASGKLRRITKSCAGGGQGNPTTNGFFPLVIDSTMKQAMQLHPSIQIHCLQDDVTIEGKDLASVMEANEFILENLAERGLKPNKNKFQLYGNSEEAVSGAPDWLTRPSVTTTDGSKAYGIIVCGAAIGDDEFVRAYLNEKGDKLCGYTAEDGSHVQGSLDKLITPMAELDAHSAACSMFYSAQCRLDYHLATHLPSQTRELAERMDQCLRRLYETVNGVDLMDETAAPGYPIDPAFTADRFRLRTKDGGSGYRVTKDRANFANAMNQCAPRLAEFFPSLAPLLGDFDPDNDDTRWSLFFSSGSIYATELKSEFNRLKSMYLDACQSAALDPPPPCFLTDPVETFGRGLETKIQKSAFDLIKDVLFQAIEIRVKNQNRDDPRRRSQLGSARCKISQALQSGQQDKQILLTSREFQTAIQSLYRVPITALHPLVGQPIATNYTDRSYRADRYGENIKTAMCPR
mmetsp:Transcript_44298/g.56727  ORF Transcript_44298/g.56727 Transcript_44298/m.56727 type:complete len:604 (+) Transcript_44298:1667-3478(+)